MGEFGCRSGAKGRGRGREAERALSAAECEALDATIEALPRISVEERAVYQRARWLVALLVRSWFRRSEVARLTMGDFHRDPHGDGWVCTVETKGGQDHTIVVTSQLLRELQVYRVSLGLSALPLPHDTLPAVGHLSSRDRHLTADMVYKVVKDLVNATADRLAASERAGEPEVALMVSRLRSVSPHWFRHTGVTRALESGTDPRYAQAQAGHASLATTMIYDHKDMRRQREQLERVR